MPRFPGASPALSSLPGSVYSKLVHRLETYPGEVYPLHVGDTWLSPPDGCRMEEIREAERPGLNRYTEPRGIPELLDAALEHHRARTGQALSRRSVLVTGGATAGLANAIFALVAPGEEVLLLAPHWPLVAGMARIAGATPVPVPVFGFAEEARDVVALLEAHRTPRTVALYLNSPNNPTGRLLSPAAVEAVAGWARDHGLWVLADQVYEEYAYRGEHVPISRFVPERTVVNRSFSKAYGMAGFRCGVSLGPEEAVDQLLKVHTHTVYSAQTASQVAALHALGPAGDAWIARARQAYREAGDRAAARLGVAPPEGSTFLFLDVARHLDETGLPGFLERCVERGLLAAQGTSFGPFPTHVRVCYTSAPPDVVARGIDALAQVMGLPGAGGGAAS